ncbi:hypothetical protein [Martelella alba]|uniref:Uncharacterized protein n=1 Tax=Martelella alba TaxID=2590451 RepID=A0ABY2SIC6_9HYPH|nr:hypothetical protein [Martelella alba]TKI04588.1 hypothetical protein FCN80_17385 [Martelella alba]
MDEDCCNALAIGAALMRESQRLMGHKNSADPAVTHSAPPVKTRLSATGVALVGLSLSGLGLLGGAWFIGARQGGNMPAGQRRAGQPAVHRGLDDVAYWSAAPTLTPVKLRFSAKTGNRVYSEQSGSPVVKRRKKSSRDADSIRGIPSAILAVLQDPALDWRVSNLLDEIFRVADNAPDVRNASSRQQHHLRLLFGCITHMRDNLDDKEGRIQRQHLAPSGRYALNRLWDIANGLVGDEAQAAIKTFKRDYSVQKHESHNKEATLTPSLLTERYFTVTPPVRRSNAPGDASAFDAKGARTVTRALRGHAQPNTGNISLFINMPQKRHVLPAPQKPEKILDQVEKVKLFQTSCRDERENMTLPNILNAVAYAMENPITAIVKEGKIVIDHLSGIGCPEASHELLEKIENALDSLLSWFPYYNNARLIARITAKALNVISDALKENMLSDDHISAITFDMVSLSKNLISSLETKHQNSLADLSKKNSLTKMVEPIKYNKNKLIIETDKPKRHWEIDRRFNNILIKDSRQIMFFDAQAEKWRIHENTLFNHMHKKNILLAEQVFSWDRDLSCLLNSSPQYYNDAILLRNREQIYALVDARFIHIKEVVVNHDIYRYMGRTQTSAENASPFLPIVTRGGEWVFEENTSPLVSQALEINFHRNARTNQRLVSDQISHTDVTPMTLSQKLQYDNILHSYIKISNNYYHLQYGFGGQWYLQGEHDIMPLKKKYNQFYQKETFFEDIIEIYREDITGPYGSSNSEKAFIDNSVIFQIKNKKLMDDAFTHIDVQRAGFIHGTLHASDNYDYLPYRNRFFRITDHGDDTYTLSGSKGRPTIHVYKNSKSNTFYFFDDIVYDIPRESLTKIQFCRSKRQVFPFCQSHYVSRDLAQLLSINVKHGIKITDPLRDFEPFVSLDGFYRHKKDSKKIIYRTKDNLYYHAIEQSHKDVQAIPGFFLLYGGNPDGTLNSNHLIAEVAILKDFHDKKVILSTRTEAYSIIFNIDEHATRIMERRRSRQNRIYNFSLPSLKLRLAENDKNLGEILKKEFMSLCSKKIVFSFKQMDEELKTVLRNFYNNPFTYKLSSLLEAKGNSDYSNFIDIIDVSINLARNNIKASIENLKHNRLRVELFITRKLALVNNHALAFFLDIFLEKLKRVSLFFENPHENIFLVSKQTNEQSIVRMESHIWQDPVKFIEKRGQSVLGFTMIGDPLDRIFLNTELFQNGFSMNNYQDFTRKDFFISLITDTLCHEAAHAVNSGYDLIYLPVNKRGSIMELDESIDFITRSIHSNRGLEKEFYYLSQIFFTSNPTYQIYTLESLMTRHNLHGIFQIDDFFKALIILNNPDTISLLIREVAAITPPAPSVKS